MENTSKLCRFCLKTAPANKCSAIDANCIEKLRLISSNLKLEPSADPIICNKCQDSLEESYKLKRTCSSSNKLVKFLRNYLGIKQKVELKELIKGNKKPGEKWPRFEHVCRVCLKSNEGAYTSIVVAKASEYGSILSSFLSELDENLTTNPLICKFCIQIFNNTCNFIKQLTNVENKIQAYCEKVPSEKVHLLDVVNLFKDEGSSLEHEENKNDNNETSNSGGSSKETANKEENHNKKRPMSEDHREETSKKQKTESAKKENSQNSTKEQPMDTSSDIDDLPPFDFDVCIANKSHIRANSIEDWLRKVEEVKSRLKWSDSKAKSAILKKMALTRLHSWLSSIVEETTWGEWKEKLVHAFPEKGDFYINITQIVQRKKKPEETFVEYFNDMQALLDSLKVTGKQAVSCLLGGLPNIISSIGRSGMYKTPEELLTFLSSCDNKKYEKFATSSEENEGNEDDEKSANQKCSSCNKMGHSHIDCTLVSPKKNLVVLLDNKVDEKTDSDQICSCCDQKGHSHINCSFITDKKAPPILNTQRSEKFTADRSPRSQNLIVLSDEKSSAPISSDNKSGSDLLDKPKIEKVVINKQSGKQNIIIQENKLLQSKNPENKSSSQLQNKQQVPVKKDGNTEENQITKNKEAAKVLAEPKSSQQADSDQGKKCACCDKLGHSSVNCPLIKNKVEIRNTERLEKPPVEQERGRQNNLIVLHESGESKFQNTTTNQNKCTFCDKEGHSSLVCPLIDCDQNTNRRNNIKITLDNQRLASVQNKITTFDASGKDDLICAEKKNTPLKSILKVSGNKCSRCNQIGHIIADCPLGRNNATSKQGTDKVADQQKSEDKLPKDQKKDQESLPVTTDKKQAPADKPSSQNTSSKVAQVPQSTDTNKLSLDKDMSQSLRKCLCCYKVGHSSLNCPLLDINKRRDINQSSNIAKQSRNNPNQSRNNPIQSRNNPNQSRNNPNQSSNIPKSQSENILKLTQDKNINLPLQICTFCNKLGHTVENCTFFGFFKKPDSEVAGNTGRNREDNQSFNNRNQPRQVSQGQPFQKTSRDEKKDEKKDDKCYYCDKVGHSSVDCFRNRFERTHSEAQTPTGYSAGQSLTQRTPQPSTRPVAQSASNQSLPSQQSASQPSTSKQSSKPHAYETVKESKDVNDQQEAAGSTTENEETSLQGQGGRQVWMCEFCKRPGHTLQNCFFARFDRNIYDAHHTFKNTTSRQCLYCGKFGHSQPDCPKNKKSSYNRSRY